MKLPSHFSVRRRFEDFESLAEASRPWDLDFRLLEGNGFQADVTRVWTPSVRLSRCRFDGKLEQRGRIPDGFRTFGFFARGASPLRWRRRIVESRHLMVFPEGDQLDSVSTSGFDTFALSVSDAALDVAARHRGFESGAELMPDSDLVRGGGAQIAQLRELAMRISDSVENDPHLVGNRWFLLTLENGLLNSLLGVTTGAEAEGPLDSRTRVRSAALKRALGVIEDRAGEPVSIREVVRQSGASGRTLRYAFEEKFGISPKGYLQAYRLNKVRRDLLRHSAAATSVAAVADRWGFWHMGQFARDYRDKFGELPSESLRRRLPA